MKALIQDSGTAMNPGLNDLAVSRCCAVNAKFIAQTCLVDSRGIAEKHNMMIYDVNVLRS